MDKIKRKEYENVSIECIWDAMNDISDKIDELVEGYNELMKIIR